MSTVEDLEKLHKKAQDLITKAKTEALAYEQKYVEIEPQVLSHPSRAPITNNGFFVAQM